MPIAFFAFLVFLGGAFAAGLRLELAKQWEQTGDLTRAVQELRLHLSEHPDDVAAYQWMGDLRLRLGQWPQALESYRSGLLREPGRVALRERLGLALEKSGDKAGAAAEWKKVAESGDPAAADRAKRHLDRLARGEPLEEKEKQPKEPAAPPDTKAGQESRAETPAPKEAKSPEAKSPAEKPDAKTASGPAPKTFDPKASAKPEGAAPKTLDPKAQAKPDPPAAKAPDSKTAAKADAPDESAEGPASGIYAMPEFRQAIAEYRSGRKDQAAATLRRVLGKSPGHPGAYYLGGVIRYEKGEYDKAVYNFKRSFAYPDKGFNAHFYLGRIYQKQGKVSEAVAAFEAYAKATQSEAGRKQAQAHLEELRPSRPKTEPAQPAAAKPAETPDPQPAAKAAPEPAPDRNAKSVPAGKPEEKPSAKAPQDAKAKPSEAEKTRTPASPPAPAGAAAMPLDKPAADGGRGLAHPLGGGLLFLVPDGKGPGAEALEQAREWLHREKYERAVQSLKSVQVDFPGGENAAAVPLNLAAVHLHLGLWQQAADQAGDYLERRGGRFERYARYLKGLALVGLGQGRAAEDMLLSVRAGHGFGPPAGETSYHLARAAAAGGDPKREAAYLGQAEKEFKDPARLLRIRQRLGQFWAGQGDPAKAADYYRKSLQACGDSALALPCAESSLRLADSESRRDPRQALAVYAELLRRHPRHKEAPWAQYQIGNLYKALGDWDAALNAYRRVIDNYPYSYWAAQAKWQKEDAVWRKEYQGVLD